MIACVGSVIVPVTVAVLIWPDAVKLKKATTPKAEAMDCKVRFLINHSFENNASDEDFPDLRGEGAGQIKQDRGNRSPLETIANANSCDMAAFFRIAKLTSYASA